MGQSRHSLLHGVVTPSLAIVRIFPANRSPMISCGKTLNFFSTEAPHSCKTTGKALSELACPVSAFPSPVVRSKNSSGVFGEGA